MAALLQFSGGPELYHRYKHGSSTGIPYAENKIEAYSSRTINCLRASWNMCFYLSPIITILLYRRGMLTSADGLPYMAKVVSVALGVYYLAHLTRGVGRMSNSSYKRFAAELRQVQNGSLPRSTLAKYDFTFTHWPVRYSLKNKSSAPNIKRKAANRRLTFSEKIQELPTNLLSFLAAHSFGRWMIYPGSTSLLNAMIEPALLAGRVRLVENYDGQRNKLETPEGNHIDTIFIDKRHEGSDNGNVLVITCEGNAAFYEAGCMEAPLSNGYSILGWNHPGFGSSTGTPYPDQEHNAIDTVVQFALNELNFPVEQIIFFSWSIGGFSSTWAAANYPECKALILDATFDDIKALAKNRMPHWLDNVVEKTIDDYFDLDNAYWLNQYDGPVRVIRRTQDEMISLDPADIRTNRGNQLLLKMLARRYPDIFNAQAASLVIEFLALAEARKDLFLLEHSVVGDSCQETLQSLAEAAGQSIPLRGGDSLSQPAKNQISLYLADKYMSDLTSTHCTPLPSEMFQLPWQLDCSDELKMNNPVT
ncbi:phosphatidylserine lipase ABHD16A-like [Watersipora subatra]|uniref:phosphatidylserine lipase ABHD16A-like n=1 Tax=Watersipora subatra TaxID=2589382 RepID=UPI00355B226D